MKDATKIKLMKQKWDRIEKSSLESVEVGIMKNGEMIDVEVVKLPSITRAANEVENTQRAKDAHVPVEVR